VFELIFVVFIIARSSAASCSYTTLREPREKAYSSINENWLARIG